MGTYPASPCSGAAAGAAGTSTTGSVGETSATGDSTEAASTDAASAAATATGSSPRPDVGIPPSRLTAPFGSPSPIAIASPVAAGFLRWFLPPRVPRRVLRLATGGASLSVAVPSAAATSDASVSVLVAGSSPFNAVESSTSLETRASTSSGAGAFCAGSPGTWMRGARRRLDVPARPGPRHGIVGRLFGRRLRKVVLRRVSELMVLTELGFPLSACCCAGRLATAAAPA